MEGKKVLNRKVYKDIKKFDREQMDNFFRNVYEEGFHEGFKNGVDAAEVVEFEIKLVEILKSTKNVGPKTISNVLETLRMKEAAINE